MNPLPPAFFLSLTVLTDLVTDMTQLRNEWANQQFSITFIIAVKKPQNKRLYLLPIDRAQSVSPSYFMGMELIKM